MMARKSKHRPGSAVRIFILGAIGFVALLYVLLQGQNIALLNPKGLMAEEQLGLIIFAAVLPLVIAVPTVAFLYYTAWKYRETNPKATYEPDKKAGKLFNVSIWVVPTAFMMVLSAVMWSATHRLEPQKSIVAEAKPLTIQVVALRWKWLFLYPEQKIATVNYVQIPKDTPVRFELTADDAPMSAFWIPNLGGMLYAMTGHMNPLNLMADTPGDYPGSVAEINGDGFAKMRFTARVSSKEDFDAWVQSTHWSPELLNAAEYDKLLKPSEGNLPAFYSDYEDGLYDKVLMKYHGSHGSNHEATTH
jgi:cytochrome o ubiquinol oxidase subunit II